MTASLSLPPLHQGRGRGRGLRLRRMPNGLEVIDAGLGDGRGECPSTLAPRLAVRRDGCTDRCRVVVAMRRAALGGFAVMLLIGAVDAVDAPAMARRASSSPPPEMTRAADR